MQNGKNRPGKLGLRWSDKALASFHSTIERIGMQDAAVATVFAQRVDNALIVLTVQPGIGTATARAHIRRFAIPRTGHSVDYLTTRTHIEIVRWFRQRRQARS